MPNSATRSLMMGVHMHSEKLDFTFEMFLIGQIDVSSQRAYVYVRKKITHLAKLDVYVLEDRNIYLQCYKKK